MKFLKSMPGRYVVLALLLAACAKAFVPARYQSYEQLFRDSLQRFENRKWDDAAAGFERLTLELPARDTLLPRSYWYLAHTYSRRREQLAAAQTFLRLTESFPLDTLADAALYEAGLSYSRLWRKPELDATYAEVAIATLQMVEAMYPNSAYRQRAAEEVARLREWLAKKDYETGMHYFRRKAYDPAIIYFQDVIERYPDTRTARDAYIRLVESYRAIRYAEEVREACQAMRGRYPDDSRVTEVCSLPGTAASTS